MSISFTSKCRKKQMSSGVVVAERDVSDKSIISDPLVSEDRQDIEVQPVLLEKAYLATNIIPGSTKSPQDHGSEAVSDKLGNKLAGQSEAPEGVEVTLKLQDGRRARNRPKQKRVVSSLRSTFQSVGEDSQRKQYWFDGDKNLYEGMSSSNDLAEEATLVCKSVRQWTTKIKELSQQSHPRDRQLAQHIKNNFLPLVKKTVSQKDRDSVMSPKTSLPVDRPAVLTPGSMSLTSPATANSSSIRSPTQPSALPMPYHHMQHPLVNASPGLYYVIHTPQGPQVVMNPHAFGQNLPGKAFPAQISSGQKLPVHGLPGQSLPVQGLSGQSLPVQGLPGQSFPVQGLPGQSFPVQGLPGHSLPVQGLPGQSLPGQLVQLPYRSAHSQSGGSAGQSLTTSMPSSLKVPPTLQPGTPPLTPSHVVGERRRSRSSSDHNISSSSHARSSLAVDHSARSTPTASPKVTLSSQNPQPMFFPTSAGYALHKDPKSGQAYCVPSQGQMLGQPYAYMQLPDGRLVQVPASLQQYNLQQQMNSHKYLLQAPRMATPPGRPEPNATPGTPTAVAAASQSGLIAASMSKPPAGVVSEWIKLPAGVVSEGAKPPTGVVSEGAKPPASVVSEGAEVRPTQPSEEVDKPKEPAVAVKSPAEEQKSMVASPSLVLSPAPARPRLSSDPVCFRVGPPSTQQLVLGGSSSPDECVIFRVLNEGYSAPNSPLLSGHAHQSSTNRGHGKDTPSSTDIPTSSASSLSQMSSKQHRRKKNPIKSHSPSPEVFTPSDREEWKKPTESQLALIENKSATPQDGSGTSFCPISHADDSQSSVVLAKEGGSPESSDESMNRSKVTLGEEFSSRGPQPLGRSSTAGSRECLNDVSIPDEDERMDTTGSRVCMDDVSLSNKDEKTDAVGSREHLDDVSIPDEDEKTDTTGSRECINDVSMSNESERTDTTGRKEHLDDASTSNEEENTDSGVVELGDDDKLTVSIGREIYELIYSKVKPAASPVPSDSEDSSDCTSLPPALETADIDADTAREIARALKGDPDISVPRAKRRCVAARLEAARVQNSSYFPRVGRGKPGQRSSKTLGRLSQDGKTQGTKRKRCDRDSDSSAEKDDTSPPEGDNADDEEGEESEDTDYADLVLVFSSRMANLAAKAVSDKKFPSITKWHAKQRSKSMYIQSSDSVPPSSDQSIAAKFCSKTYASTSFTTDSASQSSSVKREVDSDGESSKKSSSSDDEESSDADSDSDQEAPSKEPTSQGSKDEEVFSPSKQYGAKQLLLAAEGRLGSTSSRSDLQPRQSASEHRLRLPSRESEEDPAARYNDRPLSSGEGKRLHFSLGSESSPCDSPQLSKYTSPEAPKTEASEGIIKADCERDAIDHNVVSKAKAEPLSKQPQERNESVKTSTNKHSTKIHPVTTTHPSVGTHPELAHPTAMRSTPSATALPQPWMSGPSHSSAAGPMSGPMSGSMSGYQVHTAPGPFVAASSSRPRQAALAPLNPLQMRPAPSSGVPLASHSYVGLHPLPYQSHPAAAPFHHPGYHRAPPDQAYMFHPGMHGVPQMTDQNWIYSQHMRPPYLPPMHKPPHSSSLPTSKMP